MQCYQEETTGYMEDGGRRVVTVAALIFRAPSAKRVKFSVRTQNNNATVHRCNNEIKFACEGHEADEEEVMLHTAPLPSMSSIRTCPKECSPMSYLHHESRDNWQRLMAGAYFEVQPFQPSTTYKLPSWLTNTCSPFITIIPH